MDIGCLPNEVCVMSHDSCNFGQRDGKECGSFPTCQKNGNGGPSGNGGVKPSGNFKPRNKFQFPSLPASSYNTRNRFISPGRSYNF